MSDSVRLQEEAWEHADRGDYTSAIDALARALSVVEREDGPDTLDAANLLAELADLFETTCRYEDAAGAARGSVAILAKAPERDETVAIIEARAWQTLSASLRALGRFGEARHAVLEAVRGAETGLGAEHPDTAAALNALGMFHKFSGEFDLAEAAYRRAMAILLPVHGQDGPGMASLYHNLGGLHHARGAFAEGSPWARRAWEIRSRELGEDSPEATADAVALAALLDEGGPSAESERIYRRALEVWRRRFGDEHYEVASTLHNLAALRRDSGDRLEAETLFRQAYEMKVELLGPGSPDTALSAACLAAMLERDGDRGEALRLARSAAAAFEANCLPSHPQSLACRGLAGRLEAAEKNRESERKPATMAHE